MKKFETVQEWIKTNPDNEETKRILTIVNQRQLQVSKRELRAKKKDIKNLSILINALESTMDEYDISNPSKIVEKVELLQKECNTLEKDIANEEVKKQDEKK